MELRDMILFADDYAGLGWAVHEQAKDMILKNDYSDINPNAAADVERLLRGWGFDDEADEMMDAVAQQEEEDE